MDVASALNLPLHELLSDYSSGSFSNLRMAWQDAEREYGRRRLWWHRHYRLPDVGVDPVHRVRRRPICRG